jgi:hypothetical protein
VIGIIGGSRKDGKGSFHTLISYCADRPGVAHTGRLNIMFDDAASEMLATARMNPRAKDPLMHIILSWREMELPTNEQIDEAVKIALEELDLQDCQTLWIAHNDTENRHVHIVANRIHPETYKAIQPAGRWTHRAIQRAARKIEIAQGWEIEPNGAYTMTADGKLAEKDKPETPNPKLSKPALDLEAHTAAKSAERIAQETAAPVIRGAKSWEELHEKLAACGVAFERKGSGAVLRIGEAVVKASKAGRDLSMSKLESRLGEYRPRPADTKIASFRALPVERVSKARAKGEWERYSAARKQYLADKREAMTALADRQKDERNGLYTRQRDERGKMFSVSWKGRGGLLNRARSVMAASQQAEKLDTRDRHKREREELKKLYPSRFLSFKAWLETAEQSPSASLAFRYPESGTIHGNGAVSAPSVSDIRAFTPSAWNKGGVAYSRAGGGEAQFIDYGEKIVMAKGCGDEAILAALQLANQKWGSAVVNGTEEYSKKCVELAILHNLKIANPDLAKDVEEGRKRMTQRDTGEAATAKRVSAERFTGANDPDGAYWAHYRDIAAKFTGVVDYSRIDAMVGARRRVTGYSQSDVESAIDANAPVIRRESMEQGDFDSKYRGRDWKRYAAETTEKFVFGPRGAVQFAKALDYRPLYMRLEGRNAAEEDRVERDRREQARAESKKSVGR